MRTSDLDNINKMTTFQTNCSSPQKTGITEEGSTLFYPAEKTYSVKEVTSFKDNKRRNLRWQAGQIKKVMKDNFKDVKMDVYNTVVAKDEQLLQTVPNNL